MTDLVGAACNRRESQYYTVDIIIEDLNHSLDEHKQAVLI